MTRFRLVLEWDGRGFLGWQRQPHGPSVQGALETALHEVTGEAAAVQAAGRTDAGVHALAMVAHVDVMKPFAPFRLAEALNARLRAAGARVAVLAADVAPPGFHARFSCVGRAYEYRIVCRRAPLTFEAGLAWRLPRLPDVAAMRQAAGYLVGRHDFTTFRSAQCQAGSPVRTLDRLDVEARGERVVVRAEARSFLHHQVRSMVGALVHVGLGKAAPHAVRAMLEARDRAALPLNAPPDGLWFAGARYPATEPGVSERFTPGLAPVEPTIGNPKTS
ncbi:MAG: tRNA pseudouridine(38-40) synthase TruA [Sphingomonadaceae bacterium]|uniref:tRNA pseudouridine(38-40) synthase TruA n=1 Tax=Thermaurantiacus sp. TaxID=2820283 RepID=UPI00298F090A|nr:tRNA pseudouridine(38-40) synthase TruA [Thermaurantiacus sp.]MCS6986463.1 tRNA pseudouridine(38-40) synthase TruA [Sphingomonadaceae bacterium]MDW8414276.1 tRNA pseudouridine(38-40) synthase TruA [Thermaurantiacus sp.]